MDSSEAQTSISLQTPQKSLHIPSSSPSDRVNDESNDSQPSWSTKTPKKLQNRPLRPKQRQHSSPDKLPEEYEMLLRLFNGLDSALRLLRMRKTVPFFTRIRAIVESIAGRRFAHRHLAQIKYLMPEQILIKKISLVDEATGCMKRDLHVSLIRRVIKKNKKRKRGAVLNNCVKKLFKSQILKFFKDHPEGTEIPEELPAPFNEQMPDPVLKTKEATSSDCTKASSSHVHHERPQLPACHISQSLRRHFTKMNSDKKTGKLPCSPLETDVQDSTSETKIPEINVPQIAEFEKTPLKLATTPATLMANTPTLQTPDKNSNIVKKSVKPKRPSAARSLKFDGFERNNAHVELELDDVESTDILEILPQSLVQSLKEKTEEEILRRRVLKGLPKLFDRISYLFQSIKYSAIRKEALLHRLTTCHCDIVDESEVEEQLKLLQEVIPEWISQKLSPSSNILLSIDKSLDPSMLRARLHKAT